MLSYPGTRYAAKPMTYGSELLSAYVAAVGGASRTGFRPGSGAAGMSPNNAVTFAIVDCGSTSPAITSSALLGWYQRA